MSGKTIPQLRQHIAAMQETIDLQNAAITKLQEHIEAQGKYIEKVDKILIEIKTLSRKILE